MNEPAAPPPPTQSRWNTARILLLVFGSLVTLLGVTFLATGGTLLWANGQKDDDGYFTTREHRLGAPSFALVSDDLDVGEDGPDWLFEEGRVGRIRIEGAGLQGPVFVGIARKPDVDAYLRGVPHAVVTHVEVDPFRVDYRAVPGARETAAPPDEQAFWAAFAVGPTVRMTWDVAEGNWVAVLMNADASRGVAANLSFGAKVGWLLWVTIGLLVAGLLVVAGGATMLFFGARGPRPAPLNPLSSP